MRELCNSMVRHAHLKMLLLLLSKPILQRMEVLLQSLDSVGRLKGPPVSALIAPACLCRRYMALSVRSCDYIARRH